MNFIYSNQIISFNDLFLVPLYLFLIIGFGYFIKSRNISTNSDYKFFIPGLLFKIVGVSFFIIIYLFYYNGGDTVNYFLGTRALGGLILQDLDKGFAVLFNTDSVFNNFSSFNTVTGYPPTYMWRDPNTFSVSRFTLPLYLLGSKSFIITSFLTACFSYFGVWKLYRLFNILYPGNSKPLAYLILFLPSLIFWGSGIMKDSFVLGATCWISYNFYQVFIARKKIIFNAMLLVVNLFIILTIKAYVITSLVPGMLLWLNSAYIKNINSSLGKVFIFPILLTAIGLIGFYIFENLSSLMGVYGNVDTALQQAQVIQEDLLREDQYGSNSYRLGEIDGSLIGLLSVAPIAIFTALFRPLFWEIGSPTMVISALENTILIVFTIIILIRTNPINLIRVLWNHPFLFYCFVFSLFFAFGVGIAGTNFGALVRYKTPLVPFFFSYIYLIYRLSKNAKN
ncbi:MAG: hypothetical protein ACJ0QO_04420 [Parvicellaceae bacterium]